MMWHDYLFVGTMTVEAVYQDRESFASLVRDVASPDLGRMGMEILSFTIKDISDTVQYLDSLGKTQIANVKRDADVSQLKKVCRSGFLQWIRELMCRSA